MTVDRPQTFRPSFALVLALFASSQFSAGVQAQPADESGSAGAPSAEAPAPAPPPALPPAPEPAPEIPEAPAAPSEEMIVVGTPIARTAGSAHVLNGADLERFEYDDPHATLAAVPGVYVRGEDGVGLRPNIGLRGVNPDRSKKVTLMEDGVLFGPAPYSAPAAYYFPLLTRMDQLRVIKGPGSVMYGPQTVGGAIDLITRPIPRGTAGMLDLALGQYGYNKIDGYFGTQLGPIGFLIEGVHLGNTGFKELPSGADTGFYRNEVMFKGVYELHQPVPQEIRLKLTYSDELSNETYLGLTDADFRADPLQRYGASQLDRMRNHRTSIVASYIVDPSEELSIITDVYRHDYYRVWRKVNRFGSQTMSVSLFDVLNDPDTPRNQIFVALLRGEADSSGTSGALDTLYIGPNERDFVSQGVQSKLDWELEIGALTQDIELGVRFHNDRIDRRHSEDGFLIAGDSLIPDENPTLVTAFNSAETHAFAAYVVDALEFYDLTLTLGVRVETMQLGSEDYLEEEERERWATALVPGAGVFYALTDDFGVLAGAYRGFSPPAPDSSEDTEPEFSINYEAGARFSSERARAEVIGFYNDYSNLTDVCTLSSGCTEADLDRQFDAGQARIYGIEALAEYAPQFGAFSVPIMVAYTLTRGEFETSFTSTDPIFGAVMRGDELPYVPEHHLAAVVGLSHPVAGFDIGLNFVSAMREQAGSEPLSETLATDEQFVLDASAYYRIIAPVELYVNARNLLDSHDIVARRPFGARPNAPFWLQAGVKLFLP